MHPWLKVLILFVGVAVLTVAAPFAGFAIGTAANALFHLTGILGTAVVTLMLVGFGVLGVKGAQWLVRLHRRRTRRA